MKNLLRLAVFTGMIFFISSAVFSQQIDSSRLFVKEDYLKKSKKQKTGAALLLSGGTVLLVTTIVVAIADAGHEIGATFYGVINPDAPTPEKKNGTGLTVCAIAGVAAIVTSIPLFIAGRHNKKRAALISFKPGRTLQLQNYSLVSRLVPSLSLKISL